MMLGFVAGSLLALWMAPRSGAQTRDDIRRTGLTLRVRAEERVKTIMERVQGETLEESIEQGKAIAHQVKAERAEQISPDRNETTH
jgi:gas vesicle protein